MLITLGIIGVVAALTIPSLVSNYRKTATVVALRNVYSILQNAKQLSEVDNGPMSTWKFPEGYYNYNSDELPNFVRKYYLPYFRSAKECKGFNCFNNYSPVTLTDVSMDGLMWQNYFVTLADGTILNFFPNINAGYFWLYADINGYKKPNKVGIDIFVFDIYKYASSSYKVAFWNSSLPTRERLMTIQGYGCNKDAERFAGFNCGALIVFDNWQIKDGYPWE